MGAGEGSASGLSPSVKPGALTALLEELAAAPEGQREPAWEPALRPGDVVGRFELLRELGRGGFGVVWEARDQELGRKVAFKLVRAGRAEAGDKLHHEAEAVARLQHPNLVTLHDVGRCEHGPYLVLELLRGETLQARLARGQLPLGEALSVAVEVARGLAHAHAEGVVHRDLKPSNVFLCERGGVKLLDFGMAHAFGRKRVSGGTPAYMAPEQWRDAPEDERTDVFALGVMLYQMLTGALPFPDDGGRSVGEPESAPELQVPGAPLLGPLVAKMLAKDPAERTRDGGAALAELERSAAELPRDSPMAATPVIVGRPRRRRGRVAAAIAIAAAIALGGAALFLVRRPSAPSGPPSIAVLPFADMSPQHDQEYLSDGIAEEILNALAQVEGLQVSGRTSSFTFKGTNRKVAEIGRELNVRTVLEGSVRKAGGRIRITAQLVQAADGFYLWSRTFDRDLSDVFAVQDEIARAVVEALRVKLLSASGAGRGAITINREAYDQYLRGRDLLRTQQIDHVRRALAAFEKAISLDGGFALAWAGVAHAIRLLEGLAGEGTSPEQRRRALAAAEQAVALAPDLPDAYVARGTIRSAFRLDWEGSLADMERARALAPGDASAATGYGRVLTVLGKLPEAIVALEWATEIDPLWASAWIWLGRARVSASDHERGRAALARALEISPRGDVARLYLFTDLMAVNRPEQALAEAERAGLAWIRLTGVAIAQHDLGRARESRAALETLVEGNAADAAYQIAEVYAWRGETDQAFEWLERARTQADTGLEWIKTDPLLRKIRSDPRYAALLRKLNLPVN